MLRLIFWLCLILQITTSSLIPYGESEGDTYIPHSDQNTATVLSVPFVYFENKFTELFISPNGAVSFGEALPIEITALNNRNVIAVYYLKTTKGNIYHRVSKDQKVINELTGKILSAFDEARQFRATEAVLISYEDMGGDNDGRLNNFQLGLLTNGTESYAILIYSRLEYSLSGGKYAEMGFYSSNGKVESLYNSGLENAVDVAKLSMLSEKGVYAYKTTYYPETGKDIFANSKDDYEYANNESEYDSQEQDSQPSDCPVDPYKGNCREGCSLVPDSRGCKMCLCPEPERRRNIEAPKPAEETNVVSHEPDPLPQQIVPIQSRQRVSTGIGCDPEGANPNSDVCHSNARCESVNNGHCCKCAENSIGNGKDCVDKSQTSIRANGKFEGVINGQSIPSVELYAFIETSAGQQHTVINGVPQELAWSLQLLDSIGNGMAWLFGKVQSDGLENGFQLTGGVFNRTLNIHLGEKNLIVIKQHFTGRENDAVKVNIFVSGTLPTLEQGATVTFTDFEEKYTREEPGFLRAYADRHVVVRHGEQEVQHRLTVDQQIHYKECPFKQVQNNAMIVRVSRITGTYGQNDKTLRFSSQGSIYNEEDAKRISEQNNNPCINSYHICNQPNMVCKPEGDRYRCECVSGYEVLNDDNVEPKFRCVDANECARNPCDRNAECFNTLGSYSCRCRPGYSGSGKECTKDDSEIAGVASGCRSHSECHQWGECVFGSNGESGVCRCRGWYVGDGVTNCGPPQVSYHVDSGHHDGSRHQHPVAVESCERRLNCHYHAQCVATGRPDPPAQCQCRQGYEGNGTHCYDKSEIAVRLPTDNKVCTDQSDCHQFGHCVLRESENTYYCSCLPGYRGDGHSNCIKSQECDVTDQTSCGQNSQCRFSHEVQLYRCECLQGYSRYGDSCILSQQPVAQETCNVNPYVCHRDATCVYNEAQRSYSCVCKAGTQGDGYVRCDQQAQSARSCLDDRSLCSPNAQCMPDQRGVYVCTCGFGFTGNGFICNPTRENLTHPLLIARGMAIIQRSTAADVPGRQLIVVPHQVVVDIEFDCISDRIYWSDIAGASIRSSSSNGTDVQTLFKDDLRSPEGIAIDYASRNIYYVDSMKDEIGVITLDKKYQKALLTEGLVNPRALAIDLDNRKLYYSDWHRRNPHIGRVDLDGSSNQDFVKDDIGLPNGLTLLQNRRELCWVDAGKKQLSCIRLDGTGRRVVYAPLEYPFGLTHENEERFYWTDWKDNKIHSVSVYGQDYRSFSPSLVGQGKIYGILSLNHKCSEKQTECSNNNAGCKYICLPTQQDAKCVCPDNVPDAEC